MTMMIIIDDMFLGVMYVSVDDTIPGGANLGIEVTRLALEKLSEKLEALGFVMPKELHFQYDNGGENKVLRLFYYFKLDMSSLHRFMF
jgi:hypothetical protein